MIKPAITTNGPKVSPKKTKPKFFFIQGHNYKTSHQTANPDQHECVVLSAKWHFTFIIHFSIIRPVRVLDIY